MHTMVWLRCRLSFALLRASIMCIRGVHSSMNRLILDGPIDLQVYYNSQFSNVLIKKKNKFTSVAINSFIFFLYPDFVISNLSLIWCDKRGVNNTDIDTYHYSMRGISCHGQCGACSGSPQ